MNEFTHIFREAGNGFPADGTLVQDADGSVFEIVKTSRIHTPYLQGGGQSHYIYLTCKTAKRGVADDDDDLPFVETIKANQRSADDDDASIPD